MTIFFAFLLTLILHIHGGGSAEGGKIVSGSSVLKLGFNPKISTVSGGESINFESIQHTENKTQAFKIPVKLCTRNRKVMVQGTPDCQAFFIKHFKDQTSALTDVSIKDESGKREVHKILSPH